MGEIFGFNWENKNLLREMASNLNIKSKNLNSYFSKNISIGITSKENNMEFSGDKSHKIENIISDTFPKSIIVRWNESDKKLSLGRKHFNSDTIYYVQNGDRFIFSTNVNPLLSFVEERNVNKDVLDSFLTYRFNVYNNETLLRNVKKIPPGQLLKLKGNSIHIKELENKIVYPENKPKLFFIRSLKGALLESIKNIAKRSESPGVLLSGGLDSSLILALLSKFKNEINTYTALFHGEDIENIKLISEKFNTNQHFIEDIDNPLKILPKITSIQTQPVFDNTSLMVHKLMELASEKLDSILMGLGADELFGGYEVNAVYYNLEKYFSRVPYSLISKLLENTPEKVFEYLLDPQKDYGELAKGRVVKTVSRADNPADFYEIINSMFDFEERGKLYKNETPSKHNKDLERKINNNEDVETLYWFLNFDQRKKLQSQLIDPTRKISNHFNLNLESPYIGKKVLEVGNKIPINFKIKGMNKKVILRKVARDFLPEGISSTKKRHFSPSLQNWLEGETLEIAKQILSKRNLQKHDFFDPDYINRIFHKRNKSPFFYNRMIWSLIAFQIWYEIYINRKSLDFNLDLENLL